MSVDENAASMEDIIETDLLIVGAGPAGAALACFLAALGRKGIMISAAPGPSRTPRAHITNMAALECLRDIDLEDACNNAATHGANMMHTRWCYSMAGEEFARVYSWGNDPKRVGDYEAASPCRTSDLPQTELEPILTVRAIHQGWTLRYNSALESFTRPSAEVIVAVVRDTVTRKAYKVKSRYMFGCDGARSLIVRELGLPLISKAGQGPALNVLAKVDLSHIMPNRPGNLHWVFQPDVPYPDWAWTALVRMVKPWKEWMFIILPAPGSDASTEKLGSDSYRKQIRQIIGDHSIDVEILDVSKWVVNEIVAEQYSKDNVFCLGDAVHRHPPFNGLGSNTCIQDAYNLAWKMSYVMSNWASPKLLESFTAERQPVGVEIVTRANNGMRDHGSWMELTGMMETNLDARRKLFADFDRSDDIGRSLRRDFQQAIEKTSTEFHGLGIEMNQRYFSDAVYLQDEGDPPSLPEDAVKTYQITTYPGRRLPHAWLNTRIPGKQFSTIDLAGKGRFCLLTGPSGREWIVAAEVLSSRSGVQIKAYSIGWKGDFEDVYFDWANRREVEEDGCVLIRPDRFVAWRSRSMIPNCVEKLDRVMHTILSLT